MPCAHSPHQLHHHIPHRADRPHGHEPPPDPPIHPPPPHRHHHQQSRQRDQQGDPADQQRAAHLDLIRFEDELAAGVFALPLLGAEDGHVAAAQADAEQDVEHGPAEAGAQRHDGVAEAGDGDVGDEIAEGVADREDGEPEDGVRDVEDGAERLEDADDFVGDGGDPCDGHDEAQVADQVAVPRGFVGRRQQEEQQEADEGTDEAVQRWEDEISGVEGGGGVGPEDEDNEERGGDELGAEEPAIPGAGGRGWWVLGLGG